MARETANLHEVVFVAEGVEPGVARVRRFHAREGLSAPLVLHVDVELPAPMDPTAWLLGPAHLVVIQIHSGVVLRRFSGTVTRVREHASRQAKQRVSVTIESPLAVLRLTRNHRIFQHQKTQDIVTTLLADAGIDAAKISFRLSGSYPEREVATQLGETSFDFASRLLEEDGIFHFLEFSEDGATVVFADSSSAYAATSPDAEIPFLSETGLNSEQAVTEVFEIARVRPAKVTLRDHDFKRPALDLTAEAEADSPLGIEHYDFPGRYVDPAEGARRAQLRLDSMVAENACVRGNGTAFALTAGHTFTLTGPLDAALEMEWVVRDIQHEWEDRAAGAVSYRNHFHLLPKDLVFRPLHRTPRCEVPGPQLAVVTGPPGEEIHTDEHGRVQVRFYWDRLSTGEDKSSSWIRVGQMHTSGSVVIPRVGWEVVVDFEDGDPDKPIVLGRLYNGKDGPPYSLPGQKTVSALKSYSSPGKSGNNEIRMDDGAGAEHVHMRAQKDLNITIANDKTEKTTTDEICTVGADESLTVGANETIQIGADLAHSVGSSQTWAVGASRTKTVTGKESVTIGGSRTLTIGGSHTTMTPMAVNISTPASLSETVGGSNIEVAALGVAYAVAGSASMTVGGAKIEAVAASKADVTVGARATTVGGAFVSASGGDVSVGVGGAKATTVGGAWMANAAGDAEFSSGATLNITVGGAVAVNAAEIIMKVGGSTVTISAGQVAIKSSTIKLTATGPHAELAPLVEDK